METTSIRELMDMIVRGQIRIPAFQRGFVWEPERVAYLMDSIYKQYPFGSLLFWRAREKLRIERDLGPFKLPEPKDDYPVDYVLDGQQRITAIFGVFQTELAITNPVSWLDIYYDLSADENAQESQFLALPKEEVDAKRHFPLKVLFDSTAYRKATSTFEEGALKRIDDMQSRFKETLIPLQISKTEDKATVAIIFERVNRQGVELDTLQLLSAWTWSEEFQLLEQFSELAEDLSPFGFADVGVDTNLLLRCCSAVLADDASPEALMGLHGGQVRESFDRVTNGVKYAVDYLRAQFHVESLANLPFSTLLVPLSVFFAVPGNKEAGYTDAQRRQINSWFWRSAFSRRYSSGVLRTLKADILEMKALRDGDKSDLGNFATVVDVDFFLNNTFGMGNVNTKTFILMLAQHRPLSFISGTAVNLKETLKSANRAEFHHLMPKAFLQNSKQTDPFEGVLANFCFMSRADNRELGGVAPSEYRKKLAANEADILKQSLVPPSLWNDKYQPFIDDRVKLLVESAKTLCNV